MRTFALVFTSVACAGQGEAGEVEDSAAASPVEDSGACVPPDDGLLPAGDWGTIEEDFSQFSINADGTVIYRACQAMAEVERAEVLDGDVSWVANGYATNVDVTEAVSGTATGSFCGEVAILSWTPYSLPNVRFDRVPRDQLPPGCD